MKFYSSQLEITTGNATKNNQGETKLIFWSTGKAAKKRRSVGRQNKNNII